MKKIGLVLILIFMASLFGCATTKVSDTFRFESRGLEVKIGEEKTLGIIMGDTDPNSIIIYRAESETYGIDNEIIPASRIIDLNGSSSTYYYRDTTQGETDHMKVYGKSAGVVRFTAYLKDSPNVTDTILITIVDEKLGGYQLLSDKVNITVGEKMVLTTVTLPDGLKTEAIYSSDDESIAKVYQTGVVEGVGVGTVIINAKSVYDGTLIAKKEITVSNATVTEVVLQKDEIILYKGEQYQINANALPEYAPQTFTYKSSVTAVATVSTSGIVTAVDEGNTEITVKSSTSTKTSILKVKVIYTGATSLAVTNSELSVECDKTGNVSYKVGPYNANQELTIEVLSGENNIEIGQTLVVPTSDEDTKTSTLNIKGLVEGTARIKVSTANGYYSEIINITITPVVPTAVKVEAYDSDLIINETVQLVGSVLPDKANQEVIFESSDETIATVSTTGLVTAVKAGTVDITVYDATKTLKKVCTINVYDIALEVIATDFAATVTLYEKFTFTVSVRPETALQEGFEVEISNEDIAEIVALGNNQFEVEPFDVGTFDVIVTYGGMEYRKTVTVVSD